MTEGSGGQPPVCLSIAVETEWGPKRAKVPLDAEVGRFVDTVVEGCGADSDEGRYTLEVPFPDDGGVTFHQVSRHERLVDAFRGVENRPRIVPNDSDQ